MTVYVNFVPTQAVPFQFSATLDGQVYNVTVTWNLFGARYYVNVNALDSTLLVSTAMVGSPTGFALQALSWANGQVAATTLLPHGYRIGSSVELTISGCVPDAYNGQVQAMATGPSTLSWPLSADPGAATAFGSASYNIDLVGGYFVASSLVFRQRAQQFEISP